MEYVSVYETMKGSSIDCVTSKGKRPRFSLVSATLTSQTRATLY